jgi:Ser-tRNA(Ala) deacylase AlaX
MLHVQNTKLYMDSTYKVMIATQIQEYGSDNKGVWVYLSETIFHPHGGGQPFDLGSIGEFKVKEVHQDDAKEIKHYLENISISELTEFLKETKQVEIKIDIERRAINAALHTAGHWLSEIMEANYPVTTTKGHHYPKESRIEFSIKSGSKLDKEKIKNFISETFSELKNNNTDVQILYDEQQYRSIKVGSYKPRNCGGTHLSSLDQLDDFSIRNIEIKKGVLRIGYNAIPALELFKSKIESDGLLNQSSDKASEEIEELSTSLGRAEQQKITKPSQQLYSGREQLNLFFPQEKSNETNSEAIKSNATVVVADPKQVPSISGINNGL